MSLTNAQKAVIKADIIANVDLNSQPNTSDGAFAIAELYNTPATPTFTVWKSNVPIGDVGKGFNGTELGGMTTGNQTRLQTLAQYFAGGVDPSRSDTRAFFDDVFSGAGGTITRANLATLWKRTALRIEKLFSTGIGSVASPGTMNREGVIAYQDVLEARNS